VTAAPPRHRLVQLGPVEFAARVDEALAVYVAAMGYPRSTARQRRSLWLDHGRRPGWRAVGWLDAAGALVGIACGYSGGAGQRGDEGARRGRGDDPAGSSSASGHPERYGLAVPPRPRGARARQGGPPARRTDTGHGRVLLSTPEYGERQPGRAWRLYRRTGFVDVLRHHRFTGDARPFAVLGRTLPLDPPDTGAPHGHQA